MTSSIEIFNLFSILHTFFSTNTDYQCDLENQCCQSLKNLMRNETELSKLIDFSGTERIPGVSLGNTVSYGSYGACKKADYNYCRARVSESDQNFEWLHCLPKSCNVSNLNLFFQDAPLKFDDDQTINYISCYDPTLFWEFNALEITMITIILAWAVFIFFSPFENLNINKIMSDLTKPYAYDPQKSSKILKSLDGIRVISMCFIIIFHADFNFLDAGVQNVRENFNSAVRDSPWYILFLNATPAVDTFFVMGGIVTTYVLKMNSERFKNKKDVFLAIVNRTLRITPPMVVLVILSVTLLNHEGNSVTRQNQPFLMTDGYQAALANECKEYWWSAVFHLMTISSNNIDDHFCLGWMWYLSNDYWYFIITVVLLYFYLKNPFKNKKTIYAISLFMIVISIGIQNLLAFTVPQLFMTRDVILPASVDPIEYKNKLVNTTVPIYWLDLYAKPWTRISPYLFGAFTGICLADYRKKKHDEKKKRKTFTFKTSLTILFINLTLLLIVLLPLPQYYVDFFPASFQMFYEANYRVIWGLLICYQIYLLETRLSGWCYNFLSNNFWTIFARINFSAYLVHFYVLVHLVVWIFEDTAYASAWYIFMGTIMTVVFSYLMAFVFYVLIEAPVAIGSKKLIAYLRKKMY